MVVTLRLNQQNNIGEKPTVKMYTYINKTKDKGHDEPGYSSTFSIGSRIGWLSALFDKAGDKVLLSDNYQVNLTTINR